MCVWGGVKKEGTTPPPKKKERQREKKKRTADRLSPQAKQQRRLQRVRQGSCTDSWDFTSTAASCGRLGTEGYLRATTNSLHCHRQNGFA